MDIVQLSFPTGIEQGQLSGLFSILNAIKAETVPIPEHTDPGAIQDCWASVLEIAESVRHIDSSSIGDVIRERMDQYDKHQYSLQYDMQHNGNGELIQAAIAVLSNNIDLMPSSWKDKPITKKIFTKELYGRLAVASAFAIAHMDQIRVVKARESGAQVFINGVNSDMYVKSEMKQPTGTLRHCQACKKTTSQKVVLLNPDNPEEGEVWECGECHNAIDHV